MNDWYLDPPDDSDNPCMICWQGEETCPCPVCPVCETIGDPRCYMDHGLRLSEDQITLRLDAELRQAKRLEDEERFWEPYKDDWYEEYQNDRIEHED